MKRFIFILIAWIYAITSNGQGAPVNASTIKMYTTPTTNNSNGSVLVWNSSTKLFEQRSASTIGTPITLGTIGQIPFMNSGGTDFTYSSRITWNESKRTMILGNSNTVTAPTTGNTLIVGESNSISGSMDWNLFNGDVNTITCNSNNSLFNVSGVNFSGGQLQGFFSTFSSTFSGAGNKISDFIAGDHITYNVSSSSGNNTTFSKFGTISGTALTNTFSAGLYTSTTNNGAIAFGYGISTRLVISDGVHSINMSANDASQTSGHGALADYSAIIGGINSNIPAAATGSVVLGGSGIKATTATNTVWVPNLNVVTGVNADAGGLKHARVTTGSVSASSTADVTVTWTTAFADSNYTPSVSIIESNGDMEIVNILSKSSSNIVVRVKNNSGSSSRTGELQVIAIHD